MSCIQSLDLHFNADLLEIQFMPDNGIRFSVRSIEDRCRQINEHCPPLSHKSAKCEDRSCDDRYADISRGSVQRNKYDANDEPYRVKNYVANCN